MYVTEYPEHLLDDLTRLHSTREGRSSLAETTALTYRVSNNPHQDIAQMVQNTFIATLHVAI